MKYTTRSLKAESEKDIVKIYAHNNNKCGQMTAEQFEQHKLDKYNHYYQKWTNLLASCETTAQKNYCNNVLNRLHIITERKYHTC